MKRVRGRGAVGCRHVCVESVRWRNLPFLPLLWCTNTLVFALSGLVNYLIKLKKKKDNLVAI